MIYKILNTNFFYWILFIIISIPLFNSFLIDKHFSADGAYYFLLILENKSFVEHDWFRQFALYLTQWPVVLAINLGIRTIHTLNLLFAAGIYSTFLISFAFCQIALRGESKFLLIWPLLSIAIFNLNTDYHLSGEFPVALLFSWPILFLLLKQKFSISDHFILFFLLILFTRIYQSTISPSIIFIVLLLYQYFRLKMIRPLLIMIPILILLMITISFDIYSTLYPYDELNKSAFFDSIPAIVLNSGMMSSLIFLFFLILWMRFQKKWITVALFLPICFLLFEIISGSSGPSANISFLSRSSSFTIFPFTLLLAIYTFYHQEKLKTRFTLTIITIFIMVMSIQNLSYSRSWGAFKDQYSITLRENKGFIPVNSTNLATNSCQWFWTHPVLSILWSNGCVNTIVLNEERWSSFPYYPRSRLYLKEYLLYSPVFQQVDESVLFCDP